MTYLDDPARLAALDATQLMDSDVEPAFDRITRLASRLLSSPVALISLVDSRRQFFKSQHGLPAPLDTTRQTPLSHSFCQHVVIGRDVLAITDAPNDPRVRGNLAVRDLNVMAYLGVPLTTSDGHVLGSLCTVDGLPRQWTEEDRATLADLAQVVIDEIALRAEVRLRRAAEDRHRLLIAELHHRVKNTLATVQAVTQLSLRAARDFDSFSAAMNGRIASLAHTHTLLSGDNWRAVSFRALIEFEFAPYEQSGRVTLEGADFELAAQTAVALGMVLHELTTNAIKYGSLSNESGRLVLSWTLTSENGDHRLALRWAESGGPVVTAPAHTGFGSTLLHRILEGELRGKLSVSFKPDGLEVSTEVRLPREAVV